MELLKLAAAAILVKAAEYKDDWSEETLDAYYKNFLPGGDIDKNWKKILKKAIKWYEQYGDDFQHKSVSPKDLKKKFKDKYRMFRFDPETHAMGLFSEIPGMRENSDAANIILDKYLNILDVNLERYPSRRITENL